MLLINRYLFICCLLFSGILLATCNKDYEQTYTAGSIYSSPVVTNYSDTLRGYIYLNCNNSPAANYTLVLTNNDYDQVVGTYTTDNTGYYSVPYSFSLSQNNWYPSYPYVLNVTKDSLITIIIPNDSLSVARNLNFVLGNSLHYKAVFKFSQSYTNQDTLYYQFYNGQNSSIQHIAGPFPNRLVLSYNKPLKYLHLLSNGSVVEFTYGLNNFDPIQYLWQVSGPNIWLFPYKQCSNVDSVVVNY